MTFQGNFSRPDGLAMFGADVRIGLVDGERRLLYRDGDLRIGGHRIRHAVEYAGAFSIEELPLLHSFFFEYVRSLALGVAADGSERAVWTSGVLIESIRPDDGHWSTSAMLWPSPLQNARNTRRPAVTFDAAGGFHALYAGSDPVQGSVLRHTLDSPEGIVTEPTVPAPDPIGLEPATSLAITPGPLGSVHIAYLDDQRRVAYATNASGQWVSSVVGGPSPLSRILSHALAVESDGTVHLAYEDQGLYGLPRSTLMYGTNRCPGGWYVTVVDPLSVSIPIPGGSTQGVGSRNPDIALDPAGNPHISYRRVADNSLGYAHLEDGAWVHETVVADTTSGENSAIAVDEAGTVSIAHHDFWAGDLRLATRAPVALEQRWDGCPPLPDPSALREGHYIFEPPAGTAPIYDPGGSHTSTWGKVTAQFSTDPMRGGRVFSSGWADGNGDSHRDAEVLGIGKLFRKRSEIRFFELLAVLDDDPHVLPNANLRIGHVELIDSVSRQRVVYEAVRGKLDGQKLSLEKVTEDEVPAEAFRMRLELDFTVGSKGSLGVSGFWKLRSGLYMWLEGKGAWSPVTSSADVRLVGRDTRSDIRLTGLRIWRSRADGIHLRADSITVNALGQKLSADLTGAY